MNDKTRTQSAVINVAMAFFTQVFMLMLSFVTRTFFIKLLGTEYLGVNSLYANVLSVLSLADLGIGTAMLYVLYKPIYDKDYKRIAIMMRYFGKIYRIIALTVMIIGIGLVPFLGMIIKVKTKMHNLELYYLLFLANSVFSYLVVYKTSLIQADQRDYIISYYNLAFNIIRNVLQILLLVFTHSYIVFLLVQIGCTVLNNVAISRHADKLYPFLKEYSEEIDTGEKKQIFENVKAMFIYKLGGVVLNSTDNIIISSLIGTIWVGYYSNYSLLVGAVIMINGMTFSAITSSVGNLNASNASNSYEIFKVINFLNFFVYGFSTVAIYVLIDNFVYLWLGSKFILDKATVMAIAINFYIPGTMQSVSCYRDSTGLFKNTKYVFFVTTILNLVLSIVLGKLVGLCGVLFATGISRLLTSWWFEPKVLYRMCFFKRVLPYYIRQVKYMITVVALCGICKFVTSEFHNFTIVGFIMKMIFVTFFTIGVFILIYRRTEEYNFSKQRLLALANKYLQRNKFK